MAITDQDVQDVFDAVGQLNDDELKQLASKLEGSSNRGASHLANFVRAHVGRKKARRNPFADSTAQTQHLFNQATKEHFR